MIKLIIQIFGGWRNILKEIAEISLMFAFIIFLILAFSFL